MAEHLPDAPWAADQSSGLADAPWHTASMPWTEVAGSALANAPRSAGQFAHDIAQPFLHPIDTAESIGNVGLGLMEKAGLYGPAGYAKHADALGHYFTDRYGSLENAKKSIAEDPVGVLGDLSTVLTGGETALARAPGIVGKVGEIAGTAARAVDPINAAMNAGKIARKAGTEALGVTTGAGSQPLEVAARAGYDGGAAGQAFRENLSGAAPLEDVVTDARNAVRSMRQERGRAYREQMADIGADNTVLDFDKVDDAVAKAQGVKSYKGQNLSPKTAGIRQEMADAIDHWKSLDPAEFHTAEGLDALKQKLGDIRDAAQPHTPERVAADQIYNAVRQTIVDQAPTYANTMKGYEQASTQIKEIERTLSLNPNASVDTALRKLQSTLRDNVNTSFGRRTELANYLVSAGAPHLMERLAGQALHSWAPRGLARLSAAEVIPTALGGIGGGAKGAGLAALATLPLTSPRLMGNAAYGAGRLARKLEPITIKIPAALPAARVARNVGRLSDPTNPFSPR